MPNVNLPSLKLTGIPYGTHETAIDLTCLLYIGGASTPRNKVEKYIDAGKLGQLQQERLDLVNSLYNDLCADVSKGLTKATINNYFKYIRQIFSWCDKSDKKISGQSIEDIFYEWADFTSDNINLKNKRLKTEYRTARVLSYLISRTLKIRGGLLKYTRLTKPNNKNGGKFDKQNLEDTFEFGRVLFDISKGLSTKTIMGKLPLIIALRDGNELIEWSKLSPPELVKSLGENADPSNRKVVMATRKAWEDEKSHRTRYSLINLKIECEILIFISQTGMNLKQAFGMKRSEFKFHSTGDSTNVFKAFKKRRQGEVLFQIYKEYTPIFKSYLEWINENFPEEDTRLFPFIYPSAIPHEGKARAFQALPLRFKKLGIRFIHPSELRKTRINWLLRKSLDPDLTAEMAQHTKETLFNVYEIPHHQKAAIEITRFHRATDPSIAPPGPGACAQINGAAKAIEQRPSEAPEPDCISPSGCLFCFFHRDVDTFDYVWSLVSLRHCKRLELDRQKPTKSQDINSHPAALVINRICEKLNYFNESTKKRSNWVAESIDRIREGRFHPHFDGLIKLMELGS